MSREVLPFMNNCKIETALQVDGLCAMVEGVQDLVAKADQISAQEFVSFFPTALRCIPSTVCMSASNMEAVCAA